MCFRPPSANKPVKCPACGMYNPANQKACKRCGFDGTPGSGDPSKQKPQAEQQNNA